MNIINKKPSGAMIKVPQSVFTKLWIETAKADAKRIASQTPTPGIDEICDIPYLEDGTKEHLLDFYFPAGNKEKLPLIIDIHGGGWMYGYKEINKYYNYYLASKGFIVASVNYRLCPEAKVWDQINDVFSAFNWIDKNAQSYNCDMKNVFVTGDSAGGHLGAICTAIMSREDLRAVFDVKKPSFDFNAAGFVCGAFDIKIFSKLSFLENYAISIIGEDYKTNKYRNSVNMSDILLCDTELPPIWMVSSKEDFINFLSKGFDKTLTKYGKYHTFKFIEKSPDHALPHVFCITNPEYAESKAVNDDMISFFNKYIY